MIEERVGPDGGGFRGLEGAIEAGVGVASRLLFEARVPQARLFELAPEEVDRIALALALELGRRHVAPGIVGRGVRAEAIGARLDQRRAAAGDRSRARLRHRFAHREHVVAVDRLTREAEGLGLGCEALGPRLQPHRRRDRPRVVVAEEDDRRVEHSGEVAALVEVALRGGAVAEEDEDDALLAAQLHAPGEAHRLRDLRRQRDLRRPDADRRREVAAGRIAAQVASPWW